MGDKRRANNLTGPVSRFIIAASRRSVRRPDSSARTIAPSQSAFLAILLCSLGLIGCDNSCFIFVSNPGGGGGTIAGSINGCPLNQAKGSVRPRITTSLTAPAGIMPARISHIYVTIQGIEANSSAAAGDDSPDWQELAPKLVKQPAQIDLLAPSGDSSGFNTLEYAAVPADAYRQIRLRLSRNQTNSNENGTITQVNLCGNVGSNCIVTSDESVRPLILDTTSSQIQVSADHIAGGFFRILPDTAADLEIKFVPQSSLFIFTDETVRAVPVFAVDSENASAAAAPANP